MKNFLIRSLVAVIGIPALLWVFYRGDYYLTGFVVLVGLLGCFELYQAAQQKSLPVALWLLIVLTISIPLFVWERGTLGWAVWAAGAVILSALWACWRDSALIAVLTSLIHLATTLWLGVGLAAIVALRDLADGQGYLWLIFLFANLWIGDTAAYLGGVAMGGPKLSPVISPKKTISGSFAQIAASALVGSTFVIGGWIVAPAWLLITASVMIGVVGQLGDLFESSLKRAVGIKDFSSIIPGHGGVLDRFDSALFAAPALWVMIQLWLK
jgi:phosphatidate cytidylyltransferase